MPRRCCFSNPHALQQVDIPFTLLESAPALPSGGTSIALWKNAFRALEALGVADELRRQHPISISTCACVWCWRLHLHTHSTALTCAAAMGDCCAPLALTSARGGRMSYAPSCAAPCSQAWRRWCHHSVCGLACKQPAWSSYPMVRLPIRLPGSSDSSTRFPCCPMVSYGVFWCILVYYGHVHCRASSGGAS